MKESEAETLKQEKVADFEKDKATCLRFLVARDFKIPAAEEMMRNNMKWRKEVGIENYLTWTLPPEASPEFQFSVTGRAHNGGPVVWIPGGRWPTRSYIEKGHLEEARLFGLYVLETLLTKIKEFGNIPSVVILGMETLNYYKVAHLETLRVAYAFFQVLEKNYPETIESMIIINAPCVFSIGFSFMKPILSQRTLSKVQVFGADREKWLPVLRQLVPEDAIPTDYLEDSNSNKK